MPTKTPKPAKTDPTEEAAAYGRAVGYREGCDAGTEYALAMLESVARQMSAIARPAEQLQGAMIHVVRHAVARGWKADQIVVTRVKHGWAVFEDQRAAEAHAFRGPFERSA